MKDSVIILIVLLVFIIGLDVYSYYYLKNTAADISRSIEELPETIDREDWGKAYSSLAKTTKKWSSVKGMWAVLINHDEIDNIDMILARLKSFVKYKDVNESVAGYREFKEVVEHIPESQRFSLVNIF